MARIEIELTTLGVFLCTVRHEVDSRFEIDDTTRI